MHTTLPPEFLSSASVPISTAICRPLCPSYALLTRACVSQAQAVKKNGSSSSMLAGDRKPASQEVYGTGRGARQRRLPAVLGLKVSESTWKRQGPDEKGKPVGGSGSRDHLRGVPEVSLYLSGDAESGI